MASASGWKPTTARARASTPRSRRWSSSTNTTTRRSAWWREAWTRNSTSAAATGRRRTSRARTLRGGPRGRRHLSPIRRVEFQVARDLALPAVAVLEQLVLVVEQIFAGLGGELGVRAFDDGVHRTGFLAVAAVDAARHVDVVARGAAAAVRARFGLDGDAVGRADRLA